MAYLHKYNFDDVFFRSLSVGLLDVLNNKLKIWNRINDKEYEEIGVPFFYDASGDSRFMQDMFMGDSLDDCVAVKTVEGNTDIIPRGHIRLQNISINTASLTNRFVRGEFREEKEDGQLLTYNAPINHIPLDVNYEVKIKVDGELTALKLYQRLIEVFYKVHVFVFLFGGFVLKAQTGFPEDSNLERPTEHSFGDNVDREITFNLGIETYLPVINPELKFLKSQQIESFAPALYPHRFEPSMKYTHETDTFRDFDMVKDQANPQGEVQKIFIPTNSNDIAEV